MTLRSPSRGVNHANGEASTKAVMRGVDVGARGRGYFTDFPVSGPKGFEESAS